MYFDYAVVKQILKRIRRYEALSTFYDEELKELKNKTLQSHVSFVEEGMFTVGIRLDSYIIEMEALENKCKKAMFEAMSLKARVDEHIDMLPVEQGEIIREHFLRAEKVEKKTLYEACTMLVNSLEQERKELNQLNAKKITVELARQRKNKKEKRFESIRKRKEVRTWD